MSCASLPYIASQVITIRHIRRTKTALTKRTRDKYLSTDKTPAQEVLCSVMLWPFNSQSLTM